MKVSELIEHLQAMPANAPVFVMDHSNQIADPCYGAGEAIFSKDEGWEGGGICCDLEEGDVYVSIYT